MQYSGHFKITKKENTDYNFFLMKKKLVSITIIVFLVILLIVSLMHYAQGTSVADAVLQGLLMAVIGAVVMVAFNIGSTVLRINSMYKRRQLTDFELDVVLDKDGLHAKSERGDSDVPWNRITTIAETKQAFYVFLTDSHANVLPKSQLSSASDAEAIRAVFRKYMDAAKLKLIG